MGGPDALPLDNSTPLHVSSFVQPGTPAATGAPCPTRPSILRCVRKCRWWVRDSRYVLGLVWPTPPRDATAQTSSGGVKGCAENMWCGRKHRPGPLEGAEGRRRERRKLVRGRSATPGPVQVLNGISVLVNVHGGTGASFAESKPVLATVLGRDAKYRAGRHGCPPPPPPGGFRPRCGLRGLWQVVNGNRKAPAQPRCSEAPQGEGKLWIHLYPADGTDAVKGLTTGGPMQLSPPPAKAHPFANKSRVRTVLKLYFEF